jgi:ribosome biogenesis GTPase
LKLEDLGYDDFFETHRKASGLPDDAVARVIAQHRGAYGIKNPAGEYLAEVTGRLVHTALTSEDYPAVGDWVAVSGLDSQPAMIHSILPRKTLLKRKHSGKSESQMIAANIDIAFTIESVDRDFNLNRFERYLAIARDGGIDPVIVLNKTDLISADERSSLAARIKSRFGVGEILMTSAASGEGLDGLTDRISRGKTCCFLGSSGVGKSSLINRLLGEEAIRTEMISTHTGKGMHTTTSRDMYFMRNGGIVIDNPGMREIGMTDASAGIEEVFDEVGLLARQCAFRDCTHSHEPGCAVIEAIKSGKLDREKFANYAKLKKEAEFFEMTELEKRKKDQSFGRYVKRAKKQTKKPEA